MKNEIYHKKVKINNKDCFIILTEEENCFIIWLCIYYESIYKILEKFMKYAEETIEVFENDINDDYYEAKRREARNKAVEKTMELVEDLPKMNNIIKTLEEFN